MFDFCASSKMVRFQLAFRFSTFSIYRLRELPAGLQLHFPKIALANAEAINVSAATANS
jgi:hypothetical protein